MHLLAGIFVGGRASRMGGVAKGLLIAPDGEPIIDRTRRLLEELGAECVLVGAHPAYASSRLRVLEDDPEAEGPLAGILALLEHAHASSPARSTLALALACDMPLLTRDILRRLVDAEPLAAPILAARHHDIWEPFFARYSPSAALPIARAFARAGRRKLQHLLDDAGARALTLTEDEQSALVDWDTPEDVAIGRVSSKTKPSK